MDLQLRDYIRILWRGKWFILLTTLVALATAWYFFDQRVTPSAPKYQAKATVSVQSAEVPSNLVSLSILGTSTSGLTTHTQLIQSRAVLERAVQKLNKASAGSETQPTSAQVEALRQAITVRPIEKTTLLEVSAEAGSSAEAEARANAVVEAYIDYLKAERTRAIEEAIAEVSVQLKDVGPPPDLAPEVGGVLILLGNRVERAITRVEEVNSYLETLSSDTQPSTPELGIATQLQRLTSVTAKLDTIATGIGRVAEQMAEASAQTSTRSPADSLQDVTDQLVAMSNLLTGMAASTPSLSETLTALRNQVNESKNALSSVLGKVQAKEDQGTEWSQQERSDVRDTLRLNSIAISAVAGALKALDSVATDALTRGRLVVAEERLRSSAVQIDSLVNEIGAPQAKVESTTSAQLNAVQLRIEAGSHGLETFIQQLAEGGNSMDGISTIRDAIALSRQEVDVASRQLSALLLGSLDALVRGELQSLSARLSSALSELAEVDTDLADIAKTTGPSQTTDASTLQSVQSQLIAAISILEDSSGQLSELSAQQQSVSQYGVTQAREMIDVGINLLEEGGAKLRTLQANVDDPERLKDLAKADANVKNTTTELKDVTSELRQLQTGSSPGYRELIQMRQELELSRLQPQEIPIAIVDTAVSLEATKSKGLGVIGTVLLGGVTGLLLGVLGVLVRAQLDRTINGQDGLQRWGGLSVVGVIPRAKGTGNPHLSMASDGSPSPFSESIQLLGATLEEAVRKGTRAVIITSSSPGEGKTTLSINLARVLAQYDHRVLLVDGNLRKPDVARALGLDNTEGLASALRQGHNPEDHIVSAGAIHVLADDTPDHSPVALLSSPKARTFFDRVRQDYDVVLVDAPPVPGFADTRIMAQSTDGVIVVVKAGATDVDQLDQLKKALAETGTTVLGAVLNFAPKGEYKHLRSIKYGLSVRPRGICKILRRRNPGKA